MRGSKAACALAALLALSCALPGLAQTAAPQPPDLYQQALESIAEGRNNDASEALTRVIESEPLHAGAWLDLALIQCALGHKDEAERIFKRIEQRFAPPPGIIELIEDARAKGCGKWQAHSYGALALARGIDQNVNQGAANSIFTLTRDGVPVDLVLLPEFLPQHDQYTVLSGEYLRDLTPNGTIGFAQFQTRRNDSLTRYDSASLFGGVETPWRVGRWTVRGTAMFGLISLGGHLYQRQAQVQARVGPLMPLPGGAQFHVTAALTHSNYLTLLNFDSNTAELKGQLSYRAEDFSASASAGFLRDHAVGARAGGDRHGYLMTLQARRPLGELFTGELGYVHQDWRSDSAYSPGVIDVARHQLTRVLRATLIYPVSKNQNLQLEARHVSNKENISLFQYNNRQLQLSWQWNGL